MVNIGRKAFFIATSQNEFKKNVLEVLCQPLEDGRVTISRALMSITYPSRIMLVAAMNPCKCGGSGESTMSCTCTPREIQQERFRGTKVHSNSQMTSRQIRKYCEPDAGGHRLLELVTERLGFSARAYTHILKLARTIADLEGSEAIREQHLAEAIQYRSLDRKTF